MKKRLLYILLILFCATATLQAQQTTDTTSSDSGFDFDQMVNDITDIPLFLDALQARRSINVSDSGRFSNKPLATFLNLFLRQASIAVGLTESVETTNIFGTYFDITKPRGTYREGSGNHFLIFQLNFVPNAQNKREYQIKIEVEKSFAVVSHGGVDEDKWTKFDEYIDKINNDPTTYTRTDFRNAVNTLISKGLLILLGVESFPLEVEIKPLAGAVGIDMPSNKYEQQSPLYEKIVINGALRNVTNVALKQNTTLSLQTLIKREGLEELDTIEKTITLGNGKHFSRQLKSSDSVAQFDYTATIKGDDAITATYELKYEDRSFTELAGQLNISVYDEKKFKVKLVPVGINGTLNAQAIQTFLNRVYGQAVVQWEVSVDKNLSVDKFNGRLKTESGALSNYSSDMNSIISAYKNNNKTESNVYYIFIVPQFEDGQVFGYMPRKRSYGFVAYNANRHNVDSDALARTIAHELGHGAFRLNHTFKDYPILTQGSTNNLMDYVTINPPSGDLLDISRLFKYQWDFIHNPEGGLYWFQDEEDMMLLGGGANVVLEEIERLRMHSLHNVNINISKTRRALGSNNRFFYYTTKGTLTLIYEKDGTFSDITFTKRRPDGTNIYQIRLGDFGVINCISEEDRDVIYDYLVGKKNNATLFGTESLALSGKTYTFENIYNEVERLKIQMLKSGKNVTETDKLIVNVPLIQWQLGWHYASAFYYNWLTKGGDIQADKALTDWLQSWSVYKQRIREYEQTFANKFLNRPFTTEQSERYSAINSAFGSGIFVRSPGTNLYVARNLRSLLSDNTSNIKAGYVIKWDKDRNLTNFSTTTIAANEDSKPFNGWVGAFGSVSIRHYFCGTVEKNTAKEAIVDINEIIIYIEDRFGVIEDDQPLGNWKNNIFSPQLPSAGSDLSNSKLNAFGVKYNIGKDFNILIQPIVTTKLFNKIVINKETNETIYQK